jgi:predicted ATPase
VPSQSLDDEAIELFVDRVRQLRPDFVVTDDNAMTGGRNMPSSGRNALGDRT